MGKRSDPVVIQRLLGEGASVNYCTASDLYWYVSSSKLELVKVLLENGISPVVRRMLLRITAGDGQLEIVKLLLDSGIDIHTDCDFALRCAIEAGQLDTVKLLIEYGGDIHVKESYTLWAAAFCGNPEIIKFLLECGLDPFIYDKWAAKNKTALTKRHPEIVELIKEAQAVGGA